MTAPVSNVRGIAAMLFGTASFVICDTFMKLVTEALPPFQVVFLRGVAATLCCGMLLLAVGQWRHVGWSFDKAALLRAAVETVGILCYIVALARMPLADVIAIAQTAPLLLLLLVALIWREKVGGVRLILILLGFAGALLVAQPGSGGISTAALLAFATALCIALRDIAGRGVASEVPALVVAFATIVIVMLASGTATLVAEQPVWPSAKHALYLLGAGFFVTLGQLGVFTAYRLGTPAVVAPFFYSFAVWGVVAGTLVFHEVPNPLALAGIAIVVVSGLGILLLDRRPVREPLTAIPD